MTFKVQGLQVEITVFWLYFMTIKNGHAVTP